MSVELKETVKRISKAAGHLKKMTALLRECEKLREDPHKNAFVLETRLEMLRAALRELGDIREGISAAELWTEGLFKEAKEAQQRFKNSIASDLAALVKPHGLEIQGNFPELRCGVFTLLFSFEKGGFVTVYYGPKVTNLKKVPIEARKISEAILSLRKEFDDPPLEEGQFIKDLYRAYARVLSRGGGRAQQSEGHPSAPIVDVLEEMALLKQKRSFRIDPRKENYTSYGRARFSYDLAKLKEKKLGTRELRLLVASLEQTRKEETSLWVPKIPQGDGTHYAFVSFSEMPQA